MPPGPDPLPAGGDVTFEVTNDAPTMTGAKATFAIALRFPSNQTVLPDGRVVWSRNCTVNGEGEPLPGTRPGLAAAWCPVPENG